MPAIATRAASSAPAPRGRRDEDPGGTVIRDPGRCLGRLDGTSDPRRVHAKALVVHGFYARGVAPPSVAGKHGGREGAVSPPPKSKLASAQVPESAFGPGVPMHPGVVHEHGAREEIRGGNGSLHRRGKTRADAVAADADVSLVLEDAGVVVAEVDASGRCARGAEPARAHVRRELARLLFRSYGASAAGVALAGDFVHARHIFGGHLRHALGRLEALIHLAVLEVLDVVPERLVLAPRFERARSS